MTPMAVLQVMAMNGDPRAAAALAAANNASGHDTSGAQNQHLNQNSFSQNQRGLITDQRSLSQGDQRPMASFGHLTRTGQADGLLMGENQSFGGRTGLNWGNSSDVGRQQQNEMEYTRNESQQNFVRDPSRSIEGMENTNKFGSRQNTDHLRRSQDINQQPQFSNPDF